MNYKKFLAGLLSVAMFLPSVQCVTANNSDNSKTTANTSKRQLGAKEKDSIVLGVVGGGLLLAAVGAVTAKVCHEEYKKTARYIMRAAADYANSSGCVVGFRDCRLLPDYIFYSIEKDKNKIAVCYYGKNAFKNCVEDMKMCNNNYGHSDDLVWYDQRKQKYMTGKRELGEKELKNLAYFIEYNKVMYEVSYNPTVSSLPMYSIGLKADELANELAGTYAAGYAGLLKARSQFHVYDDGTVFQRDGSEFFPICYVSNEWRYKYSIIGL